MNLSGPKKNLPYLIVITILAGIMLTQSLRYHGSTFHEKWKRELFADAAGYYAYNLMWFENGYESKNYPNNIDTIMGYPFKLNGKIIKDKYTCGVAYLQLPFVGGNRIVSLITGRGGTPLSRDTGRMIDIAGMFYAWLGAIFLFYFLINYVRRWIALISIIFIVAGTNVYAYAVFHPGMAHIYSFFLFCFYLFIGYKWLGEKKKIQFVLLAFTIFLIVLIRPTDILFLPILFFIRNSFKENLRLIFTWKNMIILAITMVIVWLPQCYYWYLCTGSPIYYSYDNEGFIHAANPFFALVLFAPNNGLIPYSWIFVPLFIMNIYLVMKKSPYAIYFLMYQLVMIYLCAAWHFPTFGGAYGQRNFVQIFAGYGFILAIALEKAWSKKIVFTSIIFISAISVMANQKILSRYDHFFWGKNNWDWREYTYHLSTDHFSTKQDFKGVLNISGEQDFYPIVEFKYSELPSYFKYVYYSYQLKPDQTPFQMEMCMKWKKGDKMLFYKSLSMFNAGFKPGKWKNADQKLLIQAPTNIETPDSVFIYVLNTEGKSFQLKNVKVCFR